eukprot:gene17288-19016_t
MKRKWAGHVAGIESPKNGENGSQAGDRETGENIEKGPEKIVRQTRHSSNEESFHRRWTQLAQNRRDINGRPSVRNALNE